MIEKETIKNKDLIESIKCSRFYLWKELSTLKIFLVGFNELQ